jgi:hypothetical protein
MGWSKKSINQGALWLIDFNIHALPYNKSIFLSDIIHDFPLLAI